MTWTAWPQHFTSAFQKGFCFVLFFTSWCLHTTSATSTNLSWGFVLLAFEQRRMKAFASGTKTTRYSLQKWSIFSQFNLIYNSS